MQKFLNLYHKIKTKGDNFAEKITNFSGTWTFIFAHFIWWGVWITFVERRPYGTLTLYVSLEAILLSSLALMALRRAAAQREELHDQLHDRVNEIHEKIID